MVIQAPPPTARGKKLAVSDRLFIRECEGFAGTNEQGVIGILRRSISRTPTRRTRSYFRCHVMAVHSSVRLYESHLHKFISIPGLVSVHNTKKNYLGLK